jgi:hypothetical protein
MTRCRFLRGIKVITHPGDSSIFSENNCVISESHSYPNICCQVRKANLIIKGLIVTCIAFFVSCKKEVKIIYQNPAVDSVQISITNASPAVTDLQLYLNNKFISLPDSPFNYGTTSFSSFIVNANSYYPDTVLIPYIDIPPGYQQLGFGSSGSSNIFGTLINNFEPSGSYSIFITDTVIHGHITSVVLKDNVGTTDSTKSQIRFLNLSPDAPALDIWAYPADGYAGYKLFSGCGYLPNDFNSFINAESFTVIDAGQYYFEATIAGTSTMVQGGLLNVHSQRVITIYTKGFLGGSGNYAIDVGVIQYKL